MKQEKGLRAGNNRNRIIDWLVFAALLGAASAFTFVLFHRQTLGNPEWYPSDMEAYILEMQGLGSKYSFPYPVFFKFAALLHLFADPALSVALATMLLNSLGIVVTKLAFNRLVLRDLEEALGRGRHDLSWLAGAFLSLAAVSLFFVSMLYPPQGIYLPGIKFKYIGVFTANPFHNATYMAARPFTILAFLWYVRLLSMYEKGLPRGSCAWKEDSRRIQVQKACIQEESAPRDSVQRESARKDILQKGRESGCSGLADYVIFSFFLLVATMTKPSFTLVMVSTAGLIMLYRLFRSCFRNFIPTVQLGLCFVPTFIDLLYQYKGVFVPGEGAEGGIGFCFGEVWAAYCDNIPLAVGLAVGFPLLVLVLNWKECKKNSLFRFSWQLYLVGFAEAFLLYEKGFRKWDFNFSWGYMCGIFFCHFGALVTLLQVTAQRAGKPQEHLPAVYRWLGRYGSGAALVLQWMVYLWHMLCGIAYFGVIFSGASYY